MWPWKHNQRKEAEESTVTPSYMSVEENLRMVALQYALSSPIDILDTAEAYLKFLNGTEDKIAQVVQLYQDNGGDN